jgi:purine-binding chemotaxis protein CheW
MTAPGIESEIRDSDETDSSSQFLMFMVNRNAYGINILKIKEIIDIGHITKVPMMPDHISGVINLRGSVVPIINLARRFDQQPSDLTIRSSIIIVEQLVEKEAIEIGIIVDSISKVLEITPDRIEQAPSFGTSIRKDFIAGVGKINGQLLVLLDTSTVLSIEELAGLVEPEPL